MRRALLVFAAAALLGRAQESRAAGQPDSLSAALDAYVRGQAARGFRGAVLVTAGGRTVLDRTYGLAIGADGAPPALWLASDSKMFLGAAILALEDEGRLTVRDSIARHLPGVPADKRAITIHQLLTHTAGFGHRYAADGITDRDAALRTLLAEKLEHPIGAGFRYSNDGYNLLAILVEIVSGLPYEQYVRTRLLEPAGMTRTGFWGHQRDVPVAIAPAADPSRLARMRATIWSGGESRANWGYRGASGMFATAGDCSRWLAAVHEGRVLSNRARAAMLAPQVPASETAFYGYGWGVLQQEGRPFAVNHAGNEDWLSHNCVLWMYANGDQVIVLSNAGDFDGRGWSVTVGRGLRALLRPGSAPGASGR